MLARCGTVPPRDGRELVEWDGELFALLVEVPEGRYLVPPIVLDEEGRVIEG